MNTRVLLVLLAVLPATVWAQAPPEALIDRTDNAAQWAVDPGREFPGADGTLTAVTEPQVGPCLRLDYDFTGGGNYVTASRGLALPAVTAVAFSVRQEGGNRGFVRLQDASGQEHMGGYTAGRDWQRVVLPLDLKGFPGHYYGKDDGVFVLPLKRIIIGVSTGPTKRGSLYLKDLAFVSSDPGVQFGARVRMAEPGHIAFVAPGSTTATVELENRLAAPASLGLRVTVADWYGTRRELRMDLPATPGYGTATYPLRLATDRPNYYLISVQVVHAGQALPPLSSSAVVAPKPLNYGYDDPASFFALQLGSDGARAERVGCKWVRVGRDWRWADNGGGHYWLPDLDGLRAAHQLIMYNLTAYPPGWATRENPEATFWEAPGWEQRAGWWADFVEATARKLGPQVDTFEIQNEPDLTCMYQVGLDFAAGVERYLRILRAAAPAVRRGAPHARLAGSDVSGGDYDRDLPYSKAVEDQAGALLDVYTGHPYAGVRYFGEGGTPLWPVANQERRKCQDTLKMIADRGLKQRFWIGEKGWGLDVTADPLSSYSREFAACLVQSMVVAHSVPGVERYYWFLDEGCNEHGYEYGLWRDGLPMPAALSYAALARLLHHATPTGSPDLGPLVQLHCFTSAGSSAGTARGVAVLWSEGQRASISLARSPAEVALLDMMGRTVSVTKAGRPLAVSFERAPVYLTYPLRSAPRVSAALARAAVTNEQPLLLEAAYAADLGHLGARVRNVTNTAQTAELVGPGGRQTVSVPPAQTRRVLLAVAPPLTQQEGREIPVRLQARGDTQTAAVKVALSPLPALAASAGAGLPPLTYWEGQAGVTLDSRGQVYPPDPTVGWKSAADLSVRAWAGWDDRALYVAARVHDPVHHATTDSPEAFWEQDSLQLALDPLNDASRTGGFNEDDREFGLVLGPGGARVLQTVPERRRLDVPAAIERQGEDTIYRVALPWELVGVKPVAGRVLGLSFLVNQNNGQGRAYWMGLTPGIGEAKRPVAYRDVYLAER